MWAFGVSLYQMAVAYFPTAIKKYKYQDGPIPFRRSDWKTFDFQKLKNLIECCINVDSSKRISAQDAMNHEWFDF
jgi:serine/threonine protein kinase